MDTKRTYEDYRKRLKGQLEMIEFFKKNVIC